MVAAAMCLRLVFTLTLKHLEQAAEELVYGAGCRCGGSPLHGC